jgi:hypothetical protein
MKSLKLIGLICLTFFTLTNQQINRCSLSLIGQPVNPKDCYSDKASPSATCCYVRAINKNNITQTFCEPRPTVDILANQTQLFTIISNSYGLTYDSYRCESSLIRYSVISLIFIISLLF